MVILFLFPLLCSEFVSHTLFLSLCCYATLETFLKFTFAEAPSLWLLGPTMPCGQNGLRLAQGSPHLPAGTWTCSNFNTMHFFHSFSLISGEINTKGMVIPLTKKIYGPILERVKAEGITYNTHNVIRQ